VKKSHVGVLRFVWFRVSLSIATIIQKGGKTTRIHAVVYSRNNGGPKRKEWKFCLRMDVKDDGAKGLLRAFSKEIK